MKVGVRDISRKTGYSPATVSNALNHKRGVSKKTAEAIVRAAQELGYQRPSKLDRIEFIVARKSGKVLDENDFRQEVVDGIEQEAKRHGLPTTYVTIDLLDHGSARQLHDMCQDPSGGIVLLGTEMEEEDYEPFIDAVAPLVVVDGWCFHHPLESIVTSNESSAYSATRYLIDRGHTHIGYLECSTRIRNFPLRERGFMRAISEAHLTFDERHRVIVGSTLASSYGDMRAWLNSDPDLPTAFFAENDILAGGAMRACLENGIKVPEDISFIGFDDLPLAKLTLPALTTIYVPKRAIGTIAVQKLMDQLRNPHDYVCTTHISTSFVERDSVRSLR